MYGYEPAAMIASPLFYQTIVHPDDKLRVMESLTQMATKGSKPAVDEFRMRSKDGAYSGSNAAILRSATPAAACSKSKGS